MKDFTKECRSCVFYEDGVCTNNDVKEKLGKRKVDVDKNFGCLYHDLSIKKLEKYVKVVFDAVTKDKDKINDPKVKSWTIPYDNTVVVYKPQDTERYCDIQLYIQKGEHLVCGIKFGIEKETLIPIGFVIDDGEAFTKIYEEVFYV